MKKIELTVLNMVCTGCENRVKNALELRNDIKKVECSFENNKVVAYYDKEINLEEVIANIEDLGFEVKMTE